jgi:hypothetical protein
MRSRTRAFRIAFAERLLESPVFALQQTIIAWYRGRAPSVPSCGSRSGLVTLTVVEVPHRVPPALRSSSGLLGASENRAGGARAALASSSRCSSRCAAPFRSAGRQAPLPPWQSARSCGCSSWRSWSSPWCRAFPGAGRWPRCSHRRRRAVGDDLRHRADDAHSGEGGSTSPAHRPAAVSRERSVPGALAWTMVLGASPTRW